VVVYGTAVALVVLHAVLRGEGHALYEALARPSDAPQRTLFVLVPLATTALGGVLANLLSPGYGYVGYLVAGWGDALGEPVGTRWGRRRYRVPTLAGVPATRSLEGSAAVLLGGFLAAAAGLLVAGVEPGAAVRAAALAAGAGAVVEALSSHGLDNLTVQAAAALAAGLALN
jgi:phytol kinase